MRCRLDTLRGIKNGKRFVQTLLPFCPIKLLRGNCTHVCTGLGRRSRLLASLGQQKNRWPRSLGRAFLNPVPALEVLSRPASRTPSRDEKARQATQRPHCVFHRPRNSYKHPFARAMKTVPSGRRAFTIRRSALPFRFRAATQALTHGCPSLFCLPLQLKPTTQKRTAFCLPPRSATANLDA